jgi:transposase-like protein
MRRAARGHTVVRCPNQHDFETDMFDPEQLAIQHFVCELCGAKFTADTGQPPFDQRPERRSPQWMKDSADTR